MRGAAAQHGKAVWVLVRPNPAGRPVEGTRLRAGWEIFVGAGPMMMRHGLTMGEMGHWFIHHFGLNVGYRMTEMAGWEPDAAPGFGVPPERLWTHPRERQRVVAGTRGPSRDKLGGHRATNKT